MASFNDLGRALRDDAAANAPRASVIDVDAVTDAARARRRPRQWAVGTLSVVAVLGFGGLAVASVTPPVMIAASEIADSEAGSVESESAPLADDGAEGIRGIELVELVACGAASTSAQTDNAGLALEVRLPPNTASGGSPIDAVAVLVNTSGATVTVLTTSSVAGALTRDGSVVGEGVMRESSAREVSLAPGESAELPLRLSTNDCRNAQEPLASGVYGVTAAIAVLDFETGAWTIVVAPTAEIRLD